MPEKESLLPVDVRLDLLSLRHSIRLQGKGRDRLVFDPVRKKWIPFTSEEFVRQLFIHYLVDEKAVPASRISIEKEIVIDGISRRYDLAVFDRTMHPVLLIECKSPEISLGQEVFDQILHYNMRLDVAYLVVTNGLKTYCCSIDRKVRCLRFHQEIPDYQSLQTE